MIESVCWSSCVFWCILTRQLAKPPPIIKWLLKAEQCALRFWSEVCDMTAGKDPRTYDIAQKIMAEEVEHEAWFIELLSKRPSGHFRRKFVGQSPHTGEQGSLIHL